LQRCLKNFSFQGKQVFDFGAGSGKYADFSWYVDDIIAAGKTNPHAGCGIGNERVIQFILGLKDIRPCSLFFLMAEQSKDWEEKKQGRLFFFGKKKAVLLSVGRLTNKKKLLPSIKKIVGNEFSLYTTEGTFKFLKRNGIGSTLVYKISQKGKEPNLSGLIKHNLFDLIINIPTRERINRELTDGQLIRKAAVDSGTTIITDMEVAGNLLKKLSQLNQ